MFALNKHNEQFCICSHLSTRLLLRSICEEERMLEIDVILV
jgi:hypothetical protein